MEHNVAHFNYTLAAIVAVILFFGWVLMWRLYY
jgi:hypothetical protein